MKKVHDVKSVVKYLRAQQRAANISRQGEKVSVEWKFDGDMPKPHDIKPDRVYWVE